MSWQNILPLGFTSPVIKCLYLLLLCVFPFSQTTFSQKPLEITTLEFNTPLTREIAGEEKHSFQISLAENQFAQVNVEQKGVDILFRLSDASGKQLASFDSEMRPNGLEMAEWVTKSAGTYRLNVEPRYKFLTGGKYEIKFAELRPATEKDMALDKARDLYAESIRQLNSGDYGKAKSLVEQAIEIYQKEFGLENSLTASSLTHLARITDALGNYDEAEKINQQVLNIREKILGKDHPDIGYTFNYLALNNSHKGEFQKAIDYHKLAFAVREKNFGADHPIVAVSLINLGVVYDALGDKVKAGELYEQALEIQEQTVGKESLNTAIILNNIGKIYNDLEQYEKAEPYLRQTVAILEKLLSPANPRIFDSLTNLAQSLAGQGNINEAESLYLRILEAREKNVGENHPLTAHVLFNLGNLYNLKQDFEKSQSYYRRALEIREKVLGTENPAVAEVLSGLSLLLALKGDVAQAVNLQKRADEIDEQNISINLSIGSERQKLAYLDSLFERTNQNILIQTRFASENPTAIEFAAKSVLRQKGRVLDAVSNNLSAIRKRLSKQDQSLLNDLNQVNTELSELILNGPEDSTPAEHRTNLKKLSDERERLEDEISRRAAGLYTKSESVNLASIQSLIPSDSALLEFTIFNPTSFDMARNKDQEFRYVVYILQNQGKIKWKDIGRVKEIDNALESFRKVLHDPKQKNFKEIARNLDEKLMLPIRKLIGDKKRLLISPDGNLNLIPFEALVDENDKFLVENYAVSYLTSGRDLLRMQTPRESKEKALVIANPNFGEPELTVAANTRKPKSKRKSITATRNLSDTYFAPLSGTAREARAIQTIFPDTAILTQAQATESALKEIKAPKILHIATHGFFLEDKNSSKLKIAGIENPLLRSGLAFANANNRGKTDKDDGILTALEASGLNLWGTKLVVLSACDTGLGEVKNGEGVYGLRRSFVLAGSESLVMSLWSISDEVTRELMTNYYKNLKQGMGRGEALRQVQLEMLKKPNRQHPFYWASFIQSGEWANLDGKR